MAGDTSQKVGARPCKQSPESEPTLKKVKTERTSETAKTDLNIETFLQELASVTSDTSDDVSSDTLPRMLLNDLLVPRSHLEPFARAASASAVPGHVCKNNPPSQLDIKLLKTFSLVWKFLMNGEGTDTVALQSAWTEDIAEQQKGRAISGEIIYMRGPKTRSYLASKLHTLFSDFSSAREECITTLKLLLIYLMGSHGTGYRAKTRSFVAVLDFILRVVAPNLPPKECLIDFNNFLDLMMEYSRMIPVSVLSLLVKFLNERMDLFIRAYREKEKDAGDKRRLQATGAKVIGLVKSIEERLRAEEKVHHIFSLRRLLIETLSLTHAGLTNRSMLRAESKAIFPESAVVWQRISEWDSNDPHSDKLFQESKPTSEVGCTYSVYKAYVYLLPFLQHPDMVKERDISFALHIREWFSVVLEYFKKCYPKELNCSSTEFFQEATLGHEISSAAAFREAIDDPFFRKEFLFRCCLAFQSLFLTCTKDGSGTNTKVVPIIRKLDEKKRVALMEVRDHVWEATKSFDGFGSELRHLLATEMLWASWKVQGCSDTVTTPYCTDQLPPLKSEPSGDYIAGLPERKLASEEMSSFINWLDAWDKPEEPDAKALPVAHPHYIDLSRQAKEWGTSNLLKEKNHEEIFSAITFHKLKDYRCKISEDDDPANEIEEAEKSKNDTIFRFRLARLFSMHYLDAYDTMDVRAGVSCEAICSAMEDYDSGIIFRKLKTKIDKKKSGPPPNDNSALSATKKESPLPSGSTQPST